MVRSGYAVWLAGAAIKPVDISNALARLEGHRKAEAPR